MSCDDDDDRAYRTDDDLVSRSIRRGTRKGVRAAALGVIGAGVGGPVGAALGAAMGALWDDAKEELATKVIPRSLEEDDD